jgi:hypothetical protein
MILHAESRLPLYPKQQILLARCLRKTATFLCWGVSIPMVTVRPIPDLLASKGQGLANNDLKSRSRTLAKLPYIAP